ncbi:MAG: flavodoxin [Thermoproteota archaeon]
MLVVYYSRTGTTKKVAETIAQALGCDVEEVIDTKDRSGLIGWLRSGRDAASRKLTTIEKTKNRPETYDVVVIGTPVWNGKASTPIMTYVSQYKDLFKEVAFFCTHDGSGEGALRDLETLCGKKPLATLALRRKQEVATGEYVGKAKRFASKVAG